MSRAGMDLNRVTRGFNFRLIKNEVTVHLLLILFAQFLGLSFVESQELPSRLPKKIESKRDGQEHDESLSPGEIGPVAMVQFVQGEGHHSSPELGKLEYQTLIPIKQTLSVGSSGVMKLYTKEGCVGVLYPGSKMTVLGRYDNPIWKVQSGSFRWICPQGSRQKIYFADEIYYMEESEVLCHEERCLIRGAGVRRKSGTLTPGIYESDEGAPLDREPSTTSTYKQWELHQELAVPRESLEFAKPEKIAESRWMLGPFFGAGRYQHQNSTYSLAPPVHGMRLMSQFRAGERSWIFNLDFVEFENRENNESVCSSGSCSGADLSPTASNRYEMFLAEMGLRFSHQRSWSFFGRAGLGLSKFRLNPRIANEGFFWGEYTYYVLSLVGGVDKMWLLTSTFGVVVSAEVRLSRTLALNSSREDEISSNWSDVPELQDRSGNVLSSELTVFVGPMLEF